MDSVRRPHRLRAIALTLLLLALVLQPAAPALAAKGDCGQPSSTGTSPKSSDALAALKTAVGTGTCDLCVCDVTNDGKITASDALRILRKAVGQNVTLTCPACVPSLVGSVMAPASMLPLQLSAGPWAASEVPGPDATAAQTVLPVSGLIGCVPVSGATVELLNLSSEGVPQLPAIATTTTNADGSYKFQPAPAASSTTMVRATVGADVMRAFVHDASSLRVDPASDFVVDTAVDAVSHDSGADLGDLSVGEIGTLVRAVRQTQIDVGAMSSMASTLQLLDELTGYRLREYIASFATSTGASPSVAGNFHMLTLGATFARQFTASTAEIPSINQRQVHTYNTADPVVVDGSGQMTQALISGRSHTLTEVSGSQQQQSGPDLAINASATLDHADVNETPGSAAGSVFASDNGALLIEDRYLVGLGALAAGSDFGVASEAARVTTANSISGIAFGLRQGSGMSKSSLSGTYWMVHLELDLEATTGGNVVQRSVGARTVTHTATFDGNGGFSIGAEDYVAGSLQKSGPTPDQAPADTDVQLQVSQGTEDAAVGLTYTVASNGVLTAKDGDNVIGVGALSADGRILVLRVGDEGSGYANASIIVGLKRGSGMTNSSASGLYRSIEFAMQIQANLTPGQVDGIPSTNQRLAGMNTRLGVLTMNGAGHVDVSRTMQRDTILEEVSGVAKSSSAPDLVLDANVDLSSHTQGDGDGTENHSYSVASNGTVTIDGAMTGYLSSDGKVFLLPIPDSETNSASTGVLIALRQP